jgi:hypothetical protein
VQPASIALRRNFTIKQEWQQDLWRWSHDFCLRPCAGRILPELQTYNAARSMVIMVDGHPVSAVMRGNPIERLSDLPLGTLSISAVCTMSWPTSRGMIS